MWTIALSLIKGSFDFVIKHWKIALAIAIAAGCYWKGASDTTLRYEAKIAQERRDAREVVIQLESGIKALQKKYDLASGELKTLQDNPTVIERWKISRQCKLTIAFREIHDAAVDGIDKEPPEGFKDAPIAISCKQASNIIRWNYLEDAKKDAQILGLQAIVNKMQEAFKKVGK